MVSKRYSQAICPDVMMDTVNGSTRLGLRNAIGQVALLTGLRILSVFKNLWKRWDSGNNLEWLLLILVLCFYKSKGEFALCKPKQTRLLHVLQAVLANLFLGTILLIRTGAATAPTQNFSRIVAVIQQRFCGLVEYTLGFGYKLLEIDALIIRSCKFKQIFEISKSS